MIARAKDDALALLASASPADPRDREEQTGVGRSKRRRSEAPNAAASLASDERYRALLDAIPDQILRLDADGVILDYEDAEEQRSLTRRGAPLGRALCDVLPSPAAESLMRGVVRAIQTSEVQTVEFSLATGEGLREREARVAAAGAGQVVMVVRDITEQKRSEEERGGHVARVEMLDAISRAFAGATLDYGAALDLAVRRTSELIGDLCILAQLTGGDEPLLRPIAAYDRDLGVRDRLVRLLDHGPFPVRDSGLELVTDLGDTLLTNDLSDEAIAAMVRPDQRRIALGFGFHGMLAVPMRVLGRIVGALLLFRHRTGQRYTGEDVVFAQAIADRAGVAIHAAHLYAENQRQAEALRSVNRDLEQRIAERTAELERVNDLLRQQATEDALTGLANRRQFAATLDLEIRRARRQDGELSLLLADVDFFKRYNDAYGHPQGDDCLQRVGRVLKTTFRRAGDLTARYGGEEFAVILPSCGAQAALVLGERLRAAVEELGVPHALSDVAPHVTLSVGAASTRVRAETTPQALIQAADDALYRAKAAGRNRVTPGALDGEPRRS